jgi:hypothetical protein
MAYSQEQVFREIRGGIEGAAAGASEAKEGTASPPRLRLLRLIGGGSEAYAVLQAGEEPGRCVVAAIHPVKLPMIGVQVTVSGPYAANTCEQAMVVSREPARVAVALGRDPDLFPGQFAASEAHGPLIPEQLSRVVVENAMLVLGRTATAA